MKFNKEDKSIEINRGEASSLKLINKKGNFATGDKLKLSIVEKGNYNNVLFQKEVEVIEESNSFFFPFESDDTRFIDIISAEETFWYELELNDSKPLIAYDKTKGKKFIIYPEAPNKEVKQ